MRPDALHSLASTQKNVALLLIPSLGLHAYVVHIWQKEGVGVGTWTHSFFQLFFFPTVFQEVSRDGTSWILLDLPAVSQMDSGDYVCQAKNFLGTSEILISLVITEPQTSTEYSGGSQTLWAKTGDGENIAAYNKLEAWHVPHLPESPVLSFGSSVPHRKEALSLQPFHMDSPREHLNGQVRSQETLVRSLKVVGDTYQSVTLVWRYSQEGNTTAFNVLYTVYGQRDMQQIIVQPGKTSITIHGLSPKTKYVACICVQGLVPQKEQCVIFSTDEVVDAEATQWLINMVVISVATVIALPPTLLVCYGAVQRRCRKCHHARGAIEVMGTYLNLETLGHSENGSQGFSQHSGSEADRLLSTPSSLDSQALGAQGGKWMNEYFC